MSLEGCNHRFTDAERSGGKEERTKNSNRQSNWVGRVDNEPIEKGENRRKTVGASDPP